MVISGQQGIADMFGVSRETIDNWQRDGLPVAKRGGPGVPSEYDAPACIRWMVARELRKVREESPADRLNRVKADAIEMDLAERRGQLIPTDAIEPKLRAAMISAREAFLADQNRIAREGAGKGIDELEQLLEEAFTVFLARMSRWADVDDDEEESI